MKIYDVLVKAIIAWITLFATGGTRKTFWDRVSKQLAENPPTSSKEVIDIEEYEAEAVGVPLVIDRLVRTFLSILTRRELLSTIPVGDDRYAVASYVFPKSFWDIAKARKVFISRSAVTVAEPIFAYKPDKGIKADNLMSPEEVRLFFSRFNEKQEPDTQIKVTTPDESFELMSTLDELQAFVIGKELADLNERGSVPAIASQILGITLPLGAEWLNTYKPYDERSVAKWLLQSKTSSSVETPST